VRQAAIAYDLFQLLHYPNYKGKLNFLKWRKKFEAYVAAHHAELLDDFKPGCPASYKRRT